jgi:GT2 family glycosyltransferase
MYLIVVNYNNSNFTKLLLESIFLRRQTTKVVLSVVVVDNDSPHEDFQALQLICNLYPGVMLLRSEINLGYFGGLNLGLSSLSLSKNDCVIVGNNDLTFADDFFSLLSSRKYADDILVVAPNVITADGYHQNPHCPGRVSGFRKFLYDIYFSSFWCSRFLTLISKKLKRIKGGRSNELSGVSRLIHMGIGACYILTPAFFQYFSRLDDSVFLYGEEALLSGQVMSVNGKTFYDNELVVHHAESATLSKYPSRTTYGFMKKSYPIYRKYL